MEIRGNTAGRHEYKVELAKVFPVSFLLIFRRAFWLIALCAISVLLTLSPQFWEHGKGIDLYLSPGLAQILAGISALLLGASILRLGYEYLQRANLYFGLEDGHLVISRGIILKTRGFFPLSRITDVYLERAPLDLVFGLHTLHFSTPTSLSERFARIDGLKSETAYALQRKITLCLERSHPLVEDEQIALERYSPVQEAHSGLSSPFAVAA